MEVKIGVSDSPRELIVNSTQSPAEVETLVAAVLAGRSRFCRWTTRRAASSWCRLLSVAYVEIGPSDARQGRIRDYRLSACCNSRMRPALVNRLPAHVSFVVRG